MKTETRLWKDLRYIGPAMLGDLELLGIGSVRELKKQQPRALYARLLKLSAGRPDICVEDALAAAIAQARNPRLPRRQCQWWWWSRKRQEARKSSRRAAGHKGILR
jgi:hypothetical protein